MENPFNVGDRVRNVVDDNVSYLPKVNEECIVMYVYPKHVVVKEYLRYRFPFECFELIQTINDIDFDNRTKEIVDGKSI